MSTEQARLTAALERERGALHALPGVLATGITARDGRLAVELVVDLEADAEALAKVASEIVGGEPVVVTRSGEIVAAHAPG